MKIKFNNELFLGMLLNDEEKRKSLRSTVNPENYTDKVLRNIATALKQEEFSFVDLLARYGKETCAIAMGLSKDAAKLELAEKYKKKEVQNG